MLSKNQQKFIRSLVLKKNRDSERLFIAEGEKLVGDLLPYFACRSLFVTDECRSKFDYKNIELISSAEMKHISQLTTPSTVLAVFEQPNYSINCVDFQQDLILVLDSVQNPGNLGTIIRLADWFGIRHVVCSLDTADLYSSKTVQATMGAIARVQVHYVNLVEFLEKYQQLQLPIYGTSLQGTNLYEHSLKTVGAIIMGNEGRGVSVSVEQFVNQRLLIPNFPEGATTSESLNVAVATAIICAEFRRPKK